MPNKKPIPNKKPTFFQADLREIRDIIDYLYPVHKDKISIADRIGDENATCPDCGCNSWWLLPKESAARRIGGKAYCECLNCGYKTHL